ncbi:hypothetical protein ACLMJK_005926 [Lecanora helva]
MPPPIQTVSCSPQISPRKWNLAVANAVLEVTLARMASAPYPQVQPAPALLRPQVPPPPQSLRRQQQQLRSPLILQQVLAAQPVILRLRKLFPAAGVLVGFFSGAALGAILAVVAMCCLIRRKQKEQPPQSPDFSSIAATVSDPIYQPSGVNGFRSDFLRRDSKPASPKSPKRRSRVRSLFSRTPTLRSMRSRDAAVDGIGRSYPPRTPENQRSPGSSTLRKEPSMESIKIYSPPNGGLHRPNTTFTDMMADAGFKPGEPYLGSPGRGRPIRDV